MSKNLSHLEWLSIQQALSRLQAADKEVTLDDLFSHCIEGGFDTYMRVSGYEGGLEDDPEVAVYGVGLHRILNPADLFRSERPFTALLNGDVLLEPDPQAARLSNRTWTLTIDRRHVSPLFKRCEVDNFKEKILIAEAEAEAEAEALVQARVEIEALTKELTQAKVEVEALAIDLAQARVEVEALSKDLTQARAEIAAMSQAEPRPNHYLVISVLLEMLMDEGRKRYNQKGIVCHLVEKYGYVSGVGATTLNTLFGDANKVKKSLPPPPEDFTKVQLEKNQFQLK